MLRARGWTHEKLAQHCGVSRQAVTKAFWQPMAAVEVAIAEILDRPVQDLWPDRYTPAGIRVIRTLPRKSTRPVRRRNPKTGAAA